MVKVAGKRASLLDLTQKLLSLRGVQDGVIFVPHPDAEIARPAALVIAPTRTEAELLEDLARQVDAVFLPRPLKKIDRLPRNEVGKLPRTALLALLDG
jgi:acyl-coenzyme A synthetase/AMP-(fatty) acid ligase